MRRISENAFGIIANRWRVFRAPVNLDPDKLSMITLAALTLHDFLLTEPNSEYNTTSNMEKQSKEVCDGSWFDFSPRGTNNYSNIRNNCFTEVTTVIELYCPQDDNVLELAMSNVEKKMHNYSLGTYSYLQCTWKAVCFL